MRNNKTYSPKLNWNDTNFGHIAMMVHNTALKRTIQKKLIHYFKMKLKIDKIMDVEELFQSQTTEKHTAKLSINNTEKTFRAEVIYVTPMKFRVISGISTDFSYIGQCNLINTCFGLLQVWYTPGGSICRICHVTSMESILTLIRSY